MSLKILGLAEVRYKGADSFKLSIKTKIYSHVKAASVILFDEISAKSWCPILDRDILVKLIAKLGIIQVYAPILDSEDIEMDQFYEEIEKTKSYLKLQDIIMIMEDFNANVGDEKVEEVLGPVA
ncbi:craniofacial development protein 2-like [Plakobranchus ocellatus]|uniref:Craniofacial development protein 2-like n=1 Tax=Plakobranchus ocellatus TaxID=259542 RepID=A0AAV4ANR9_9GAST|nr:craniofacial development protein 2-like [Plakobranchus ocellatus]